MSDWLKAARQAWETRDHQTAIYNLLRHLEALEQSQPQMDAEGRVKVSPHQHPLSVAGVKYLTEEPEEVGTPSVSTSPSPSGIELSASADENLTEWLQRCPLPTTMGGFRLIVRPGSVTLWTSDGVGTLTIPTGILGPPITSGSEQGEPGDPGQAPAAAEHGSFEMCNAYIFTDQVPGPQCMLQKGHRGFCSPPPRESRKEGTR